MLMINSKAEVPFRHSVCYHFMEFSVRFCKRLYFDSNLTDKLWTDYERCAEKSIDDDNDHKF